MKNLKDTIVEKLIINSTSKLDNKSMPWDDEELEHDYREVNFAYTKAEKKKVADKYGCTDLRIKSIQLVILDKFKENRQCKKEFTPDDIKNFFRYDPPETYDKFKKFLDEEPEDFIKYFYEYYEAKINKDPRIKKYRYSPQLLSYADRRIIKIADKLKKYMNEKGIN